MRIEWNKPEPAEHGSQLMRSKCGKFEIRKERNGSIDNHGNDRRWWCYEAAFHHDMDGAYIVGWFRDCRRAMSACQDFADSGADKPNVLCSDALNPP